MSKTIGLVVAAMALSVGITGGALLAPAHATHAATPNLACGTVDTSRFTAVTTADAFNGKVTLTRVRLEGTVVMNTPGDYTDFHIQLNMPKYNGTLASSMSTEDVQEFRTGVSPMPGAKVYVYGYLRKDAVHNWYEVHPAVDYQVIGNNGQVITDIKPTCQAPATSAYTPQTVTQVVTGAFAFPRTQVSGTVVGLTTYNKTPSFWLSDGKNKILAELNPEFVSVQAPKVGQHVTVFGIPRQDGQANNRWELNPVFAIK